jgi:hypothetical protein
MRSTDLLYLSETQTFEREPGRTADPSAAPDFLSKTVPAVTAVMLCIRARLQSGRKKAMRALAPGLFLCLLAEKHLNRIPIANRLEAIPHAASILRATDLT